MNDKPKIRPLASWKIILGIIIYILLENYLRKHFFLMTLNSY